MSCSRTQRSASCNGLEPFEHLLGPTRNDGSFLPKSKRVWSGNTTISHCRPAHSTVRKSHRSLAVTRHKEDNESKATSSLFHVKMIAKLEMTQSNSYQVWSKSSLKCSGLGDVTSNYLHTLKLMDKKNHNLTLKIFAYCTIKIWMLIKASDDAVV